MRPRDIGPKELNFENEHIRLSRRNVAFEGFDREYMVSELGERAGVVLIRDDKVLLVSQYRILPDDIAWEIPGGRVDDGETPEQGKVRWEAMMDEQFPMGRPDKSDPGPGGEMPMDPEQTSDELTVLPDPLGQ